MKYIFLADFLSASNLAKSKTDARRLIEQGAVKMHRTDNENNILKTVKITNIKTVLILCEERFILGTIENNKITINSEYYGKD